MDNNIFNLNDANNIYVTVLGWEDRFKIGSLGKLKEGQFDACVLFIYRDYFDRNDFHPIMNTTLTEIESICASRQIHISKIELRYNDKNNSLSIIQNAFDGVVSKNIMLGISSMPREIIWSFLTIFKNSGCTIQIHYNSPVSYDEKWLCRNFDKPKLQIGHSGISKFGAKTALIVFTGFDFERTQQLINHFEPDIIHLFIQDGDQYANTSRNIDKHIKHFTTAEIETNKIDCYDIEKGVKDLIVVARKLEDYNVVVASQGPKLSAIIAYQIFLQYDNVSLCYVPAKDINLNYSSGCKKSFDYSFSYAPMS